MHRLPRSTFRRRPYRQAHPIARPARRGPSAARLAVGLVLVAVLAATIGAVSSVSPVQGLQPVAAREVASLAPARVAAAVRAPSPAPSAPLADPAAHLQGSLAAACQAASARAAAPSPVPTAPGGVTTAARGSATRDRRPVLQTGSATHPIRAVFLGDSYTSGWNGAGLGSKGWPAIVSRALRWRATNLSVPGTGYVNPGWTAQPVMSRVSAAIAAHPQVVILAAGHNDGRFGARAASRAANAILDRLHARLPRALIVVIAPIWGNGSPPASMLGIRDALRRKAVSIGAVFIDPLAGGWFAGNAHRLIMADGIHPGNAGHRRIASFVLAGLRRSTVPAASASPRAPGASATPPPSAPTPRAAHADVSPPCPAE